jgi:hypothetical protein
VAAFRAPIYFINLWLISDRHRYCTYLYYLDAGRDRSKPASGERVCVCEKSFIDNQEVEEEQRSRRRSRFGQKESEQEEEEGAVY